MSDTHERRGWFRVYYKLQENPVWKTLSPAVLKVFLGMLLKAQRFPQKEYIDQAQREFPAGSFRISHRDMATFCGLSVQQVRDAYEHLRRLGIATYDGTQAGTIITLSNYRKLQGLSSPEEASDDHENNVKNKDKNTPGTHLEQGQIENSLFSGEFYKSFKSDDALAATVPSDAVDKPKRQSVSQKFPLTSAAMGQHFPVDSEIIRRVVRAAQKVDVDISDAALARVIHATRRRNQESPGLWINTVPAYLRSFKARDPSNGQALMSRGAVGAPAKCQECFDTGEMFDKKGVLVPCGCRTKTQTTDTSQSSLTAHPIA